MAKLRWHRSNRLSNSQNPSSDLVLGQDWLWMYKAKISFECSPKTYVHHAKIEIDGMSIPLIDGDFNKASSSKNKSFDHFASGTETDSSESNFHNCPRKKMSKAVHYTTTSGESKLGLTLEELTNMIKKSLSDAEDTHAYKTRAVKKRPI